MRPLIAARCAPPAARRPPWPDPSVSAAWVVVWRVMNRKYTTIAISLVICAAGLTLGGCKEAGPAEKAGKAVDNAADKATEATGDALNKAGDAVKESTK